MNPPDGWRFGTVCFRNDAIEIYAACDQGWKGCVYRYKWDADKSQYVNTSCVKDGIGPVHFKCLSAMSDTLLALCQSSRLYMYNLE